MIELFNHWRCTAFASTIVHRQYCTATLTAATIKAQYTVVGLKIEAFFSIQLNTYSGNGKIRDGVSRARFGLQGHGGDEEEDTSRYSNISFCIGWLIKLDVVILTVGRGREEGRFRGLREREKGEQGQDQDTQGRN